MNYLTNTEVAKKYGVSKAAVTYWVDGSLEKKNNLELEEVKGRYKILDTEHNRAEMSRLAETGKKYRSSVHHKEAIPDEHFASTFSVNEAYEIAKDLEVNSEIDFKFTYKNGGAKFWDDYYTSSIKLGTYKTPARVINLLGQSLDIIAQRINKNTFINIVDLGPGNSHPVKKFISELSKIRKINKYVSIDISQEMIDISSNNIAQWFPDLSFDSYVIDNDSGSLINTFSDIRKDKLNSINLIIDLGGTIGNHRDINRVLKNISGGMLGDDIFILSNNSDIDNHRVSFSQNISSTEQNTWIIKDLGIDMELCQFFSKYNDEKECKVKYVVLDKDYTIDFTSYNGRKVELYKNQDIVVWRHYMTSTANVFKEFDLSNLNLVAYNTEIDLSHVLMICQVKA